MAAFYYRSHFFIIAYLGFAACGADENTENAADATCMLHKDLTVLNLHAEPSSHTPNKNNLNAFDRDYILDGDQSDPPKYHRDPPKLFRLVCGSFAFLAVLLAVPCAQKETQYRMSWYLFNHAIAAFSAQLIFEASKESFIYILANFASEYTFGYNFLLLVIAFLATYVCLIICETDEDGEQKYKRLFIVGHIGTYTTSFAAADAFHMYTQTPTYVNSYGAYAFAFILAILAVVVINALATYVLRIIAYADHFAAVVIGFLICQAVEKSITRSQPSPSKSLESVGAVTPWIEGNPLLVRTDVLLAIAVGFVVLALLVAAFTRVDDDAEPGPVNLMCRNSCLMTAAWCAFDVITWEINFGNIGQICAIAPGTQFAAFFVAFILTFVVLVAFNVICLYSQVYYESLWNDAQISNFRLLVGAMGFAIGIAWASCVINVIQKHFFVINCLVLSILILSIWIGCIVPYARLPKLSTEYEVSKP